MRVRAVLVSVAVALGSVVGPLGSTSASAACSYELSLVGNPQPSYSLVQAPPGLAYAPSPSSGTLPNRSLSFSGSLNAVGEGCQVPATAVRFQSRDAGSRTFVTRRTGQTSADGSVQFAARPSRTAVVRLVATAPDGTQLVSRSLVATVRTAISARYAAGPGCRLTATGSTYPAKPGHPVRLQIRVGQGFRTVASGTADGRGVYRIGWAAPCGAHDLVTYVPPSATNDAGRPFYVQLRFQARA